MAMADEGSSAVEASNIEDASAAPEALVDDEAGTATADEGSSALMATVNADKFENAFAISEAAVKDQEMKNKRTIEKEGQKKGLKAETQITYLCCTLEREWRQPMKDPPPS